MLREFSSILVVCLMSACPSGPATPTGESGAPGSSGPETTSGATTGTTAALETTGTSTATPTTGDPTTTTGEPACGNGVVEADEACDDGNLADGDCCPADCAAGATEPGQVCWTVVFEGDKDAGDRGLGVVLDDAGEVYVLATVVDQFPGSDILVRRYDPGAVSQWTQQFDGGVNGADVGLTMAGDGAGFMIAAGRMTTAQGEPSVPWLTKCTPTGQTVWTVLDPGPISAGGLAMAEGGEFVLVGVIQQGGNDALIRRHDADGGELWTAVHAGADGGSDAAAGVAVDAAGELIVVGREFTDAQGFDVWIRRYGPDGTPGWSATVDGPAGGNDWASDVAVGPDDTFVVVGRVEQGDGFADAWLRKYGADGEVLWTRTFAGEAGGSDEAVAVAVAPGGEFAVTGRTAVAADDDDIFVAKHAPDGEPLWLRTHGGAQGVDDPPGDVAIAADGSVVAIGTVGVVPMVNSDVWLRKYGP
jgi:cysteine-rich repeat protein